MELLFEPEIWPFTVSIGVLVGLVFVEAAVFFLGAQLFSFIDDLVPEIGEADAPETAAVAKALAFIGVGKVPVIMVIMALLGTFGAGGIVLQNAWSAVAGGFIPLVLAIPVAFLASLALTGRVAALLAWALPSEETSAVSGDALIGRPAVVSYGEATHTLPASAKTTDPKGGTHFVQLKAAAPEDVFVTGERVTIVSRKGGFYFGAPAVPDDVN